MPAFQALAMSGPGAAAKTALPVYLGPIPDVSPLVMIKQR